MHFYNALLEHQLLHQYVTSVRWNNIICLYILLWSSRCSTLELFACWYCACICRFLL